MPISEIMKNPSAYGLQAIEPLGQSQYNEIVRDINADQLDQGIDQLSGIRGQRMAAEDLDRLRNNLLRHDIQTDLSPMMSLVDSFSTTGKPISQAYKAPTSGEDIQKELAALTQGIAKAQGGIADNELDLLKQNLGFRIEHDKADNDSLEKAIHEDAETERTKMTVEGRKDVAEKAGSKPTAAAVRDDKKIYNDFTVKGGSVRKAKAIKTVEDEYNRLLKDPTVTGPKTALLPWKQLTKSGAYALKSNLKAIALQGAKEMLTGSMSDQDIKNLVEATYDENLTPQETVKRTKNLLDQLRFEYQSQKDFADFYQKNNGRMDGYSPKIYSSQDFGGGQKSDRQKRIEELELKKKNGG
jgi:hypothetical protein